MTSVGPGNATPEKRRDRVRLSVLDPVTNGVLADLPLEADYYHETRAFAKKMVRDRNAWDVNRRQRGGLFGTKLLKKCDADRALSVLLRELATGGAL